MSFYLAIISPLDSPLYELSFQSSKPPSSSVTPSASNSGFPTWSSFTNINGSRSSIDQGSNSQGLQGGHSRGTSMQFMADGSVMPVSSSHNNLAGISGSGAGLGGQLGNNQAGIDGINNNGPIGISQNGVQGPDRALFQMIAFRSLDGIEEVMESTGNLYLRGVDKYNEWTASAYLAMGDLWELWVKILLNPFQTVNTPIRNNQLFESKVKAAARKHL